MKLKTYQTIKIKHYLKNESLLIFANGINQKAQKWIKVEQGLKKMQINYFKTYNKIIIKTMGNSIFSRTVNLINGPFFLLKPKAKTILNKNIILKETLDSLKFRLLSIKLNNKIYSIPQIKNINSFNNKETIAILYQFLLVHLKFPQIIVKFRNNVI
jgi:hypothetical protein